MIKKFILPFSFLIGFSPIGFSQGGISYEGKEIIDTLEAGDSKILLFADKTWSYVEDNSNFDGILNEHVHNLISDTSINFKESWHTDMPFTYDNDIHKLTDTLWLCTVDESYNEFCVPVKGTIVSKFKYRGSRFHHGLDIDLDVGDTVLSAFAGRVRYAQYNKGGFGNLVIIRHYNGLETYYAHLSKITVEIDQEVGAGELIGLGGQTGRAYGPHLHFETRFYDHAFDPYEIIDFDEYTLKDSNLLIHPGMFDYKAVSKKNSRKYVPAVADDASEGSSTTTNTTTNTTAKSSNTSTSTAGKKYHSVRSGDTLSGIATKYGTTVTRLCELNGISRTSILNIGQRIRYR